MCAKESNKKGAKTTNAPVASGSQTPKTNTRQTPSKTQSKGNTRRTPLKTQSKRKSARQQSDESANESDDGSDNNDEDNVSEDNVNESDNESSNGTDPQLSHSNISDDSVDFLGRPPSEEPSESNDQPNEDANENTQQTNGSSVSRPSMGGRRRPRKQSKPKKKRKDRITMEIRKLKLSTKLLVPRLPFQRLVREVLQEFKQDYRMQSSSLECLQEAAESYLVQLFEDCYLCCLHRSRVTLTEKDIRLVQILRGPTEVGRR